MDKNQKSKFSIVKRKFSIFNYQLKILLLLAAMIAGCSKDTPVDNPDNPETPVNVVMQNVALTGLVKDAGGNPLSGVKVTTGSLNATTGGDGTFSFTQAGTVDSTVVVKFEKSGYFSLTRSGDKRDEMNIEAMLYPNGNDSISLQTSFDAAKATTLQLGGMKIDLPANCMAKADGTAYSGTVRANVLYLNPANENTRQLMPGGDLTCIRSDKSKKIVIPIGMMDVVFTDNSGNPLEIKNNTNVPVSFPVPSGATAASVPHWTFNEAKGIWVEDGSLSLKGNVYTGTVSHFSGQAAGKPYESVTIQVQTTECDNKPAAGASVNIIDAGWGDNLVSGITNSAGYCSMKIPVSTEWNTYLVVQATYKGERQQSGYFLADINYGKQSVVMKFSGDCGYDLTFNLKPGPSSDKFIIECVPAMPLTKTSKLRYQPTLFLLDPSEAYGGFLFKKTECKLNGYDMPNTIPVLVDVNNGENWNADFTEYTYVIVSPWWLETAVPSFWSGTVQMEDIAPTSDWPERSVLDGPVIKSIKIGSNNPISVRAEIK